MKITTMKQKKARGHLLKKKSRMKYKKYIFSSGKERFADCSELNFNGVGM